MSKKNRKILIISTAFPPQGGVGVMRTLKFVKYLSTYDWKPIVWSFDRIKNMPIDESLLEEIPSDVKVYRAKGITSSITSNVISKLHSCLPDSMRWRYKKFKKKIFRHACPDSHVIQAINYFPSLWWAVIKNKPDLIYSSFSPATNHWLAYQIHKITGIPFVADFRDLWMDDKEYIADKNKLSKAVQKQWTLQKNIIRSARRVIATTKQQTKILSQYDKANPEKFITITNGYDSEDFVTPIEDKPVSSTARKKVMTISFVGHCRRSRIGADCIFDALHRLMVTHPDMYDKIQLKVIGSISSELKYKAAQLKIPIVTTGFISHKKAIEKMMESDLLCAFSALNENENLILPSKIFEYLYSCKPVLYVGANSSPGAELIEKHRAGIVVNRNTADIARAILQSYTLWQNKALPAGCTDDVNQYSRKKLTADLSQQLHIAVSNRSADEFILSEKEMLRESALYEAMANKEMAKAAHSKMQAKNVEQVKLKAIQKS